MKALVFSPQSLSCMCRAAGRGVRWCLQGKAEPYSCRHWELVVWLQQSTITPLSALPLLWCFSLLCTGQQASSAPAVMKPVQMGDCAPFSLGQSQMLCPMAPGEKQTVKPWSSRMVNRSRRGSQLSGAALQCLHAVGSCISPGGTHTFLGVRDFAVGGDSVPPQPQQE